MKRQKGESNALVLAGLALVIAIFAPIGVIYGIGVWLGVW